MAAYNNYVNADVLANRKADSYGQGGLIIIRETWEVASTDDAASIYRIRRVPDALIPLEITFMCDAITGMTDNDLGTYKPGASAAAIDADILMDGQTFASASRTLNGLANVAIEYIGGKTLWQLVGDSASRGDVDLTLTANADPTAAGTVTFIGKFLHP